MRLLTLFNSVFFSPSATAATKQFLITDYGAIGDNKTINTFAIQNAIDAAAFAGGGNVVIPSTGVFKTATLRLKSNVFLYLPTGSTLYASANVSDYIAVSGGNWDNWDLFHTVNQENTGIIGDTSGGGVISGAMWEMITYFDISQNQLQPIEWHDEGCVGECRPRLVVFEDCSNVIVKNIHMKDSADWTQLYRRVNGLLLENNVIFGSQQWPNNDGIDLESSQNVVMRNVSSFTGDDGLVFSSGHTNGLKNSWSVPVGPTRNVLIENCTFSSYSSAIKFSAIFQQTHGNVENITIKDTVIFSSGRAIGFQQRTGAGYFTNISFENVHVFATKAVTGTNWWSKGEAVWMTSTPQNATILVQQQQQLFGGMNLISFKDCYFESELGVVIIGFGSNINSISFDNVTNIVGSFGNQTRYGVRDLRPLDQTTAVFSGFQTSGYFVQDASVSILNGLTAFRREVPNPFSCVLSGENAEIHQNGLKCGF